MDSDTAQPPASGPPLLRRGTFESADGRRIAFTDHVDGDEPMLFIQGLSLSGDFWFNTPATVRARRSGVRPILIDNRGTGRSRGARAPRSLAVLADDCAALLDVLAIERAWVVGLSMGGMVAQHLAIRHPGRVRGLVLVATSACVRAGPWPAPTILRTLARGVLSPSRSLDPLAALLLGPNDRPRATSLLTPFVRLAARAPTPRVTVLSQLAAVASHDTRRALRSVTCPTEILAGDADALVPPAHSHTLAQIIPNARYTVFSGVGHGLPLCAPTAIPDAIERLLPAPPRARDGNIG